MEIGECCNRKNPEDFCEECHANLVVFFIKNQKALLHYLSQHNYKEFKRVSGSHYKL